MSNTLLSPTTERDVDLLTFEAARSAALPGSSLAALFDWVKTYPMNPHCDLGRAGAVCPFTARARKLDTIRISTCLCGPGDEDRAFALVRRGFRDLDKIPAGRGMEKYRVVVVGFPECADEEGIAMLDRVQRRHKFFTLPRFRMMGFMHPSSTAGGIWNPAFRALRAPMPVLAIRYLVAQDAPFVVNHHLLIPPYLLRFGLDGIKRLRACRQIGATRRADRGVAALHPGD